MGNGRISSRRNGKCTESFSEIKGRNSLFSLKKNLDEVRLKNLFKNFFEKSIDIFRKSDIINNVKRESRMTKIKMGGDLSADERRKL